MSFHIYILTFTQSNKSKCQAWWWWSWLTWQCVDLVVIVLQVRHLRGSWVWLNQTYRNYILPPVISLEIVQQSSWICLLCINVVRHCNDSNWLCDSYPNPLCRGRNYLTSGFCNWATSPEIRLTKAAYYLCWQVRLLVRCVEAFLWSALKVTTVHKICSKNKQSCKKEGCHHQSWQAWHDSSHF